MIARILFISTLLLSLAGFAPAALAVEETHVTFLGVALDPETQQADRRLREFLRADMPLRFETRDQEYGAAINTLKQWNENEQGPLIARVTPYVYVVAEMLGDDWMAVPEGKIKQLFKGKSLRELDLRGRSGVQVLEWGRGERLMPVDPDAPLREGDVLALAGSRAQILEVRELW